VNRCRRRKDRLHLPGKPSEKGGYREFQCAPARRVARRRYLLLGARSPDRHRKLAAALQHNPAARLDRLPRPGPEVFVPALTAWPAAQPRPAPPAMLPLVPKTNPKLTFQSDHLLGAGQASPVREPRMIWLTRHRADPPSRPKRPPPVSRSTLDPHLRTYAQLCTAPQQSWQSPFSTVSDEPQRPITGRQLGKQK
jgi:hypothetical protein